MAFIAASGPDAQASRASREIDFHLLSGFSDVGRRSDRSGAFPLHGSRKRSYSRSQERAVVLASRRTSATRGWEARDWSPRAEIGSACLLLGNVSHLVIRRVRAADPPRPRWLDRLCKSIGMKIPRCKFVRRLLRRLLRNALFRPRQLPVLWNKLAPDNAGARPGQAKQALNQFGDEVVSSHRLFAMHFFPV